MAAINKLYPPTINGTLPPFYEELSGAVNITVPFSMSRLVSRSAVQGLSLKIKNALTDQDIGVIYTEAWDDSTAVKLAYFELPPATAAYLTSSNAETKRKATIHASMEQGAFYKFQLAYVNIADGRVGYYSTIGTSKYTQAATVLIQGANAELNPSGANLNTYVYTGVYYNEDYTERVYEYKFTVYDILNENAVIETTGWTAHNNSADDRNNDPRSSVDIFQLKWDIAKNASYRLQYQVKTINGMEVSSVKYLITGTESIAAKIKAKVLPSMDYDNGIMIVTLKGENDAHGYEASTSGKFILSRSDESSNYAIWTKVDDFCLYGQQPSKYVYKDYSVMHGVQYKYAIQQYNDYDLYSARIISDAVRAEFEDMFLYDGERQLRIRFNPKVTSFKITIQETKKTTLGAKYPFYFRNGIVEYREFPISGLLSYWSDNDEYFMSRVNELGMPYLWQNDTDLTDENMAYERRFKMKVLEWLNNGEVKLFRSPAEGNYIVRLLNVSLSPNDTVSRMLHTFSCTANEVDDCTIENLEKYNFFTTAPENKTEYQLETIQFAPKFQETINANGGAISDSAVANTLKTVDLLSGAGCRYIKFEDCDANDMFSLDNQIYRIGLTGVWEMHFSTAVYNLKFLSWSRNKRGQVQIGKEASAASYFDDIIGLEVEDIALDNLAVSSVNDIYAKYNNCREAVNEIRWLRFLPRNEIVDKGTTQNMRDQFNAYIRNLNSVVTLENPIQYNVAVNAYQNLRTLQDLCLPDVIYKTTNNGTTQYWRYVINNQGGALVAANPGDTYIHYGTDERGQEVLIDVSTAIEHQLILGPDVEKPDTLWWGDGVQCEASLQIRRVTYALELTDSTVRAAKERYLASKREWKRLEHGLRQLSSTEAATVVPLTYDSESYVYYIWTGEQFYRLTRWDRENWDNSLGTLVYQYAPAGITEAEKNAAKAQYEADKENFLNTLENALRAQGVG